MTSRQALIQEDTEFRILRLLEKHPDTNQRDLASQVGMSLGGVNYCLKSLMEQGLVQLANLEGSRHKFRCAYQVTESGLGQKMSLARRFLTRKIAECEALKVEIDALLSEVGIGEMDLRPHRT